MALIEKPCRRNRCMSSLVMAWILPPSKRISGTSQACPNRVGQLPAKRIPLRANGEGLRLLRIGTLRANRGGFGDCLSRARDAAQTLPTGHPAAARRVGPRRGRSAGLACGGCSSWASAGAVLCSGVGSARARVSFDEHARSSLAGLAPSRRLCESAARSGSHPSSAGALDRRWRHALASSISLLRGQTPDCFAVMHVAGRVRVPMCYWAVRGR